MNNPTNKKNLALAMSFSVRAHERDALLRIMSELNLRSAFDVVRLLAAKTTLRNVKPGDFGTPKTKSY